MVRQLKLITCPGLLLLLPAAIFGAVSGPCGDCHTMHNSQDGDMVNLTSNPSLLRSSCIGCHQGFNGSSPAGNTPFVLDLNMPNYGATGTEVSTSTLAGGNFYWVSQGQEAKGHNVAGLALSDSRHHNTPPGGSTLSGQLSCAGTNGCHGDRTVSNEYASMKKSHHGNDGSGWQDGSTLSSSYRFLNGVQGLEDTHFEYHPLAGSRHNKYYGIDRQSESENTTGTISDLCSQCHENFHEGSGIAEGNWGTGVWLRHPTNFDMSRALSSQEYDNYNDGTGTDNPYSVISPVATSSTDSTLNTTIYTQTDDAIVMCLSCHRAHGTPYDAILRWDYKGWPSNGYNGCAVCHSTKD